MHQLIESFLELLPYPYEVNGQPRSEFKTAIRDKHPESTSQSLDESLSPILSAVVAKMIMRILR